MVDLRIGAYRLSKEGIASLVPRIMVEACHFELFGVEQGAREAWASLRLLSTESKTNERLWKLLKGREIVAPLSTCLADS